MPVIPSSLPIAPPARPDATIRFVYKCRLCGALDAGTGISPPGPAFPEATRILTNSIMGNAATNVSLLNLHQCRDGQIGVTDLAGAWHD